MALRPRTATPSPRALADDLEHWLADEPVQAYPEPPAARLARWGRRHKPAVAGAAGLSMAAIVALSIGTVLSTASGPERKSTGNSPWSIFASRRGPTRC